MKPFLFLISTSTYFPIFSTDSYLPIKHPPHFLFSELTTLTNRFTVAVCPHIRSQIISVPPTRKADFLIPHKLKSKHEHCQECSIAIQNHSSTHHALLNLANHRVHRAMCIFTSCGDRYSWLDRTL